MVTFLKKTLAAVLLTRGILIVAAGLSILFAVGVYRTTASAGVLETYEYALSTASTTRFDLASTMAYDAQEVENFAGKLGQTDDASAFSVTLIADGTTTEHEVDGGTVSELLRNAGINVRETDEVTPSLDTLLQENDVIRVKRRAYITRRVREPIPAKTLRIPTFELASGEEELIQQGEDGLRIATYAQVPDEEGNEGEEYLHSEEILRKPVHTKILTGFTVEPVSDFNFEYAFDENGEPVGYEGVLRTQRAAGYSARAGARTASGLKAGVGHVAVNPKQIPYGKKLYIASPDGKFVYGYAIAADTGTALTQGLIGVDLFYDTYAESANNGIKNVDIYILE